MGLVLWDVTKPQGSRVPGRAWGGSLLLSLAGGVVRKCPPNSSEPRLCVTFRLTLQDPASPSPKMHSRIVPFRVNFSKESGEP